MRILLLSILAFLALPSAGQEAGEDAALDRLLEVVRTQRDRTTRQTFNDLARKGDPASFEALLTAIGWLRRPAALADAYNAFWFFRGNEGLARRALEFLSEQALEGPARYEAVYPLSHFAAAGQAALVRLVAVSRDADVRQKAMHHALGGLLASGEESALRLVLAHAEPESLAERAQPFRAFDPDVARPWLLAKLKDRSPGVGWVLVLIEALRADPGEDVVAILCDLLRHRSTVVQVAALTELVRRGEEVQARAQLERMRISAAPSVKIEVVRILTGLARGDAQWRATLDALAGSPRTENRIAAAVGLGQVADAAALERLAGLLEDRSWKVRDAVFDVAVEVRRMELLRPLLRRLEHEQGALRFALVQALERLTGLALGRDPAAWMRWYEEEGEGFVLPSAAEVEALVAERAAKRSEDASVAAFYGLPVYSQNACFVVDLSGSMDAAAEGEPGLTRFDVAKRELASLLARLPPDSRCNLVFFGDDVEAWQRELRAMDEKGRAAAQAFVAEREMGGGTNLYGALREAFEDDATDTLYVMSDGAPSAGDVTDALELRAEVAQWNRAARVTLHCISVGRTSRLLADLARDSGGLYLEVGLAPEVK